MGCEGKVEEAQGVMKLVDQLKEERDMLTAKVSVTHNWPDWDKSWQRLDN